MSTADKSLRVYYGLDIGGTKMELVVCTDALEVCYRRRVATPTSDYEGFLETIAHLLQEADAEFGEGAAVGLGMPGVTDPVTGQQVSSNVPALDGRSTQAMTARALRSPKRTVALPPGTRACSGLSWARVRPVGTAWRVV